MATLLCPPYTKVDIIYIDAHRFAAADKGWSRSGTVYSHEGNPWRWIRNSCAFLCGLRRLMGFGDRSSPAGRRRMVNSLLRPGADPCGSPYALPGSAVRLPGWRQRGRKGAIARIRLPAAPGEAGPAAFAAPIALPPTLLALLVSGRYGFMPDNALWTPPLIFMNILTGAGSYTRSWAGGAMPFPACPVAVRRLFPPFSWAAFGRPAICPCLLWRERPGTAFYSGAGPRLMRIFSLFHPRFHFDCNRIPAGEKQGSGRQPGACRVQLHSRRLYADFRRSGLPYLSSLLCRNIRRPVIRQPATFGASLLRGTAAGAEGLEALPLLFFPVLFRSPLALSVFQRTGLAPAFL